MIALIRRILIAIWDAITNPVDCPYQDPDCHQRECDLCRADSI